MAGLLKGDVLRRVLQCVPRLTRATPGEALLRPAARGGAALHEVPVGARQLDPAVPGDADTVPTAADQQRF